MKIVIVDYGIGNIGSIIRMINKAGADAIYTSDVDEIRKAEKLILPGVGAFDVGMKMLDESGLLDILNQKVFEDKTPILGICLGMQLMTNGSEEGNRKGLSWIDADTKWFGKVLNSDEYKIPHMGWNTIKINKNNTILETLPLESRFYFVHSYYVSCNNSSDVLSETGYGINFVSSFQKDNIVGVQFHPEKSHKFGLEILRGFVNWQYGYKK
jgi:glutamine amidotransferase